MFARSQIRHPSSALNRAVSVLLAALVLLLAVASVSPQLHDALHAESEHAHQCDGHGHAPADDEDVEHSCAVTLFEQGASSSVAFVELPGRTDVILAIIPLSAEVVWCGQAPLRQRSRAPPIEIVV